MQNECFHFLSGYISNWDCFERPDYGVDDQNAPGALSTTAQKSLFDIRMKTAETMRDVLIKGMKVNIVQPPNV